MFESLRRGGGSSKGTASALPLYSPLSAETFDTLPGSPSSSTDHLPLSETSSSSDVLMPAQRHATVIASPWLCKPTLSRFLADFTLGFADGLTVPFALTAGLSSLGQTDTVIYAGMAEICAGSISMGIGGYLSARGDARGAVVHNPAEEEVEAEKIQMDEKAGQVVDKYLAPLDLPSELLGLVQAHIAGRADVAAAVEDKMAPEEDEEEDALPAPWMSGLSVALGYLIGGSLPLFPYFIVKQVGDGLLWSFIVCVIALFSFGFIKDFVLHMQKANEEVWLKEKGLGKQGWTWRDICRSSWEGTQMVILGSLAALAAVLCVRLFEGMGRDGSQP